MPSSLSMLGTMYSRLSSLVQKHPRRLHALSTVHRYRCSFPCEAHERTRSCTRLFFSSTHWSVGQSGVGGDEGLCCV